jgi:nitrate reductase molybdenum cofactor assembly chaperone NarJ/NarW
MSSTMSLTLRALAALLRYPDAELRSHANELRDALAAERVLTISRLRELSRLLDRLQAGDAMQLECDYVDTFDRSRRTALHLFEHVHGDSRDRGPAMVDLAQTYERAGLLLAPGELPDHLAVVLEFASTQPPRQARAFLGETAHIVRAIFSALVERQSPYASVLAAVLEAVGERAQQVRVDLPEEPTLDEAWAEPAAFGGCSTEGQAKPGQPQPIQIVRRKELVQ